MRQRQPTKRQSFALLKSMGLKVETVIDVGVEKSTPELIEAFPYAHHILIEPVEEFRSQIEVNYSSVSHTLVQAAASDRDGSVGIVTRSQGDREDITHSSVDEKSRLNSVRQIKLDTLLDSLKPKPPYLVKIDVDGHERQVVSGAQKAIKNSACVVIEAPLNVLKERHDMLSDLGLKLWDITDLCYYYETLSQVDLIFINPVFMKAPELNPMVSRAFDWNEWKPYPPTKTSLILRIKKFIKARL